MIIQLMNLVLAMPIIGDKNLPRREVDRLWAKDSKYLAVNKSKKALFGGLPSTRAEIYCFSTAIQR